MMKLFQVYSKHWHTQKFEALSWHWVPWLPFEFSISSRVLRPMFTVSLS